MDDIIEKFISGFCRTINGTNTVCAEYTQNATGEKELEFMDCAWKTCQHHASCEIYKEARRSG